MSNEALPNDTVNTQTSTVNDTNDEIEIDISNTSTKQTSLSTTLDSEKPTTSTVDDLFTINDFEVPITKKSSNNVSSKVDSKRTSRSPEYDLGGPSTSTTNNFEGPSTSTANNFGGPSSPTFNNFGGTSTSTANKLTSRSPEYDLGGPSTSTVNNFEDPSTSTINNFGGPSTSTFNNFGGPSTSTANNFEGPSTSTTNNFGGPSTSTFNNFGGPSTSTVNNLLQELDFKEGSASTVVTFGDNDTESNGSDNPAERAPLLNPPVVVGDGRNRQIDRDACNAIISTLLNIIMVILGALNIETCEVLGLVSMYFLIAGAVGLILKPFVICCRKFSTRFVVYFMCIISLIETAWLIFVSYWVYTVKPDFDPGNPSYCNKVAYYLAFWMLTIYWIIVGLGISYICCSLCVVILTYIRLRV